MKYPNRVFYLSGGMTGLSEEERNGWRTELEERFADDLHVNLFNPNNHWDIENPNIDDREAMRYDLHRLRNSDVVIVNFNKPMSVGTNMEIAIAYELRIPIIGINSSGDNFDLHPWQVYMCQKIVTNLDDLYEYLLCHYMYND